MKQATVFSFLMMFWAGLLAQNTVSGKVIDEQDQPLIGVNILEKGTSNGAVTDVDGAYSLKTASPNATLVFSYTGFVTQEISL
ncbi:MAG: carboxypeptidase-like regulatory domain-containing protein, partial [Phaeodactylibacter sp.]|nr:carboxypeptidase-like regulatory domain-containing protein [Phaeodactylibacter sp.]